MMPHIRNLFLLIAGAVTAFAAEPLTTAPAATTVATQTDEILHPFFRGKELPRWSKLTPQQSLIDAEEALQRQRVRLAAICNLDESEANFDNTFMAIEQSMFMLQDVALLMQHLSMVSDSAELRAAYEKLSTYLSASTAELHMNEKLLRLMKVVMASDEIKDLPPAKQRAAKQMIDIFIQNGAELSPEAKMRKIELEQQIFLLSRQYDKNIQDFQQSQELLIKELSELDGLDRNLLTKMHRAALERGYITSVEEPGWLVSLHDFSALEVLSLCDVESTRKKCWETFMAYGRGTEYDNAPVIAELMEKRTELAKILGFNNYADFMACTRMVSSGDEAMVFVDDLMQKLKPAFEQEKQQILDIYNQYTNKNVKELPPWDELKACSMYMGANRNHSSYGISAYLRYTDALNGMLSVYSTVLGVQFKQLPTACPAPGEECPEGKVEVWHPSVKCIAVYDAETQTHLGTVFLDLFRRADKRSGAWCTPVQLATPGPNGEVVEPHVVSIQADFNPPVKGQPTLISHTDLTVIFHEFGHAMHNVLSHTELKCHVAMGVSWDFTELPSTLSENWAWEPEILSTFARHYKTRKPCPKQLLEGVAADRYCMAVGKYMDLLRKAKLDLEIHVNYENKFRNRDLDAISAELVKDYHLPMSANPYSPLRDLSHSFAGGYSAGVYTYLWSAVMAADAFSRFKKEGLTNPDTGKAYRHSILDKGDSIAPDELYRMFMGRNPDPAAFLDSILNNASN